MLRFEGGNWLLVSAATVYYVRCGELGLKWVSLTLILFGRNSKGGFFSGFGFLTSDRCWAQLACIIPVYLLGLLLEVERAGFSLSELALFLCVLL